VDRQSSSYVARRLFHHSSCHESFRPMSRKNCPPENFYPRTKISKRVKNICPTGPENFCPCLISLAWPYPLLRRAFIACSISARAPEGLVEVTAFTSSKGHQLLVCFNCVEVTKGICSFRPLQFNWSYIYLLKTTKFSVLYTEKF